MLGLLFVVFLLTLIAGAILQTAGDELHALWLRIVDALHHSPAEQYYKKLRDTHAGN